LYVILSRSSCAFRLANKITVAAQPTFNEAAMSQLEGMGFPTIRCQKALQATGNSDAETAMTWLFEHMEDPGKAIVGPPSTLADQ